MTGSNKLFPAALAALLLLPGCGLVDAVEVAVSGPHCGSFGVPPGLEKEDLYILGDYFDWGRIDGMIAVLEPFEQSHSPIVLSSLGLLFIRKAVTLSDDSAYFRRGVHLLRWAALCGDAVSVAFLSDFHREGAAGLKRFPELAACLERSYDPHKNERALIPGRVWGCGVRLEDLPE